MSRMEHDRGEFWPVKMTEKEAEEICRAHGLSEEDLEYYEGSWVNLMCTETDGHAIIKPLGLCRININELDEDFTEIEKNPDGTYNFHILFYNGGAHHIEVLENGLKKLKGKRMPTIEELKDNLFKYKKKQISEIIWPKPKGLTQPQWEKEIKGMCRRTLKDLRDALAHRIYNMELEADMRANGHTAAYQKRTRKILFGYTPPYWESIFKKIRRS